MTSKKKYFSMPDSSLAPAHPSVKVAPTEFTTSSSLDVMYADSYQPYPTLSNPSVITYVLPINKTPPSLIFFPMFTYMTPYSIINPMSLFQTVFRNIKADLPFIPNSVTDTPKYGVQPNMSPLLSFSGTQQK